MWICKIIFLILRETTFYKRPILLLYRLYGVKQKIVKGITVGTLENQIVRLIFSVMLTKELSVSIIKEIPYAFLTFNH